MSRIEEELIKSSERDRWGFSFSPTSVVGQTLVHAALPVWAARQWTVTMLKQRYQSGPLVVADALNGDPDEQSVQLLRLRVEWGVGGASARAVLDYPPSGGTFQVHASVVRIFVDAIAAVTNPPLSGVFMSPSQRNFGESYPSTTLTERRFLPVSSTALLLSRPSMAVAYRLVVNTELRANSPIAVQQLTRGLVSSIDYAGAVGAGEPLSIVDGGSAQGHMYPTRQQWIPLMSSTTGVSIQNPSATVTQSVDIQWLLDLG